MANCVCAHTCAWGCVCASLSVFKGPFGSLLRSSFMSGNHLDLLIYTMWCNFFRVLFKITKSDPPTLKHRGKWWVSLLSLFAKLSYLICLKFTMWHYFSLLLRKYESKTEDVHFYFQYLKKENMLFLSKQRKTKNKNKNKAFSFFKYWNKIFGFSFHFHIIRTRSSPYVTSTVSLSVCPSVRRTGSHTSHH